MHLFLIIVVTGSNKGIGYGIVRVLSKSFQGDVLATARNVARGEAAIAELKKEGHEAKFYPLDITDPESVANLAKYLKKEYGGLDILVNNAGIAYKNASTAPFTEQASVTVKCNFHGTLNVCRQLFPLLRPHSRVVNLSSMSSVHALHRCSKNLQQQFTDTNITMPQLEKLMDQFIKDVADGVHESKGWPSTAYGTSKIGVSVMSFILQRELDQQHKEDIVVNACCPGYVDTDMTSHKGPKTIDQGADTPAYLALLPPDVTSPRGEYVTERKIQTWV